MKRVICALSISLLTITLGTAIAEPQLSLDCLPENLATIDDLWVFGSLKWDSPGQYADVYLVVIDDAWEIRFVTPGCDELLDIETPFYTDLWTCRDYEIVDYPLGEYSGEMLAFAGTPQHYWLGLVLTEPGTTHFACQPTFFDFTALESPTTWSNGDGNYTELRFENNRWRVMEFELTLEGTETHYGLDGQVMFSCPASRTIERNPEWELNAEGCGIFEWNEADNSNYYRLYITIGYHRGHAVVDASYSSGHTGSYGRYTRCSLDTRLEP